MTDHSHLDRKYFIDSTVYNCPFCNRNNVPYSIKVASKFNWNASKRCYIYITQCDYCGGRSMHLSYSELRAIEQIRNVYLNTFRNDIVLDEHIFYSQPTSFFTIDERVPAQLRALITEAEGCLKMNYLVGASACIRKAIYEFASREIPDKTLSYEDRIKALKAKFPDILSDHFDNLYSVQRITSDQVHEESWKAYTSAEAHFLLETLRTAFFEVFVAPDERKQRRVKMQQLSEKALGGKTLPAAAPEKKPPA